MPVFGLIQEEVLQWKPVVPAMDSVASYESWKNSRQSTLSAGIQPSFEVFVATEGLEPPAGYADAVRVTRVTRKGPRARGPRFGSLVHLVLRDIAYDASPETVSRIAATHGRLVAATEEEIESATDAVAGCLKHPLIDLALKAGTVHRELPIVIKTDTGAMLDAVIDLAFEDASGWTVVDFKTDAEDAQRLIRYRRQVGWYVRGLEVIKQQRPVGWLLHL